MASLRDGLDFLKANGCEKMRHTGRSYVEHLYGEYQLLKKDGHREALCLAGLFHSIYGTTNFPVCTLELTRRHEVVAAIGEEAESLAYLNCAVDLASFDNSVQNGAIELTNRFKGADSSLSVTNEEWKDLKLIQWYDWLEKVHAGWIYKHRHREFAVLARDLGLVGRHIEGLSLVKRCGGGANLTDVVASSREALGVKPQPA